MRCNFINDQQVQCNANAMDDGSGFCFSHNPSARDAKLEAVMKGGLARKKEELLALEPLELKSSVQIISLLEDTINRIRKVDSNGEMSTKTANTVGFLATHLLRAIETSDLDKRLDIVESVIFQRRIRGR
jgi:hypothetical protein